jgi:SPP1 family phage portal protein
MELNELNTLIGTNPAEYVSQILKNFKPLFEYEAWKHYDVIFHDVLNKRKRPDKQIMRPTGDLKPDGTPLTVAALIPVNRIAIPFQKFIVQTLATFLTGGCIDLKCTPEGATEEAMYKAVKKVWTKNKLIFLNNQIAEYMMSETEVAELWFTDMVKQKQPDGSVKEVAVLKMNILAPSLGYELQPFWDGIGNLIAFGVKYKLGQIEHYDLYTDEQLIRHEKINGVWSYAQVDELGNPNIVKLSYGKIPIIYYSQLKSEWYDVQSMIERLEKMQSNHGDTNDYTGSPILFIKGLITGFAAKGEPGKVLQAEGEADAKYLLPDTAPESMTLEFNNLKAFIHLFSGAPDLSLQSLKGLGQIPSGAAFERMLIATYMKVKRRQVGDFGINIQRRNNFIVAALANIQTELADAADLDVTTDFGLYQIDDLMDRINAAITANGGKPVISQEESVDMANLTDDADETWQKIQDEQNAIGNVFNSNPNPAPSSY